MREKKRNIKGNWLAYPTQKVYNNKRQSVSILYIVHLLLVFFKTSQKDEEFN